jgi:hypothetical protein
MILTHVTYVEEMHMNHLVNHDSVQPLLRTLQDFTDLHPYGPREDDYIAPQATTYKQGRDDLLSRKPVPWTLASTA